MNKILDTLKNLVGDAGLVTDKDIIQKPSSWQADEGNQAMAIVRPASTEEVSAVLKACHKAGQAIVPLGGKTGLVRGTESEPTDIMLSLERMTTVEDIDTVGKTITVQAGATLQAVHEAVEENGLQFALDLGARGSCTIGGNIATNAGGNQVLRYGMMREQVLGLEAVMADGTIISSMNSLLKNNAGYDIKQMFIGSEGTLGVVTRTVLRLHPLPRSRNTILVGLSSFDDLVTFFSFMGEQLGGGLTAFEVMWHNYYQTVAIDSGRHNSPLSDEHEYYVIVEQQGGHPERDEEVFYKTFELAMEGGMLSDAVLAQSEPQRREIWSIREDVEELYKSLMPACIFDVSLPIIKMDNYITGLQQVLTERWGEKARFVVWGHMGDGNLHLIISAGDAEPQTRREIEHFVYKPLLEMGGSVSAEHGIGIEKRDYLHYSRNEHEIAVMRQLKKMMDPKGILNPHKIFQ